MNQGCVLLRKLYQLPLPLFNALFLDKTYQPNSRIILSHVVLEIIENKGPDGALSTMPPKVTFPGVYIEEIPSGVRDISGVPTSTTAFMGRTLQGPVNQPVEINSVAEFEQTFGGLSPELELPHGVRQFFLNGGSDAFVVKVSDPGADQDFFQGLASLGSVDLVNLVLLPGVTAPAVLQAAADYCLRCRSFLIVDAPQTVATPAQMREVIQNGLIPQTPNGAIYFPWIVVTGATDDGGSRPSAPSGAVAGIFARTDRNRGVWKAPAGQEALLDGVDGTVANVSESEAEQLNGSGINPIRNSEGIGTMVWGARTLAGADQLQSEWKYVPVRRMALFLEESIYRGTKWAVFEPNDERLWAQIRLTIGAFLNRLFRAGAFQGQTPGDAYYVKCDSETTTQEDLQNGVVNVLVGFAPLKHAEFTMLKIAQIAGQRV